MDEGLKIALFTGLFWVGVAIGARSLKKSPTNPEELEDEQESVWPSADRQGLFGNKDRGGRPGSAE